jgi:ABC-type dipeptide/oligopeptide/nickel transport system permease component
MKNPFRHSILLRAVPTHRQARAIIARLEADLTLRNAVVETRGADALAFRMPYPWRAPAPTWLLAASSGEVAVTAAGGGPWRVRFTLHFQRLLYPCAALSLPLAGYWLRAPRPILLESLLSLWLAGYALLSLLATASLARLVRAASIEVIERRKTPRSMGEEKAVVTNDS